MKNSFENLFTSLEGIIRLSKAASALNAGEKLKISSFPGSSKALYINSIIHKENQVLILEPGIKEVDQLNVEFSVQGMPEHVVVIKEFTRDAIQEKLTDISNRNKTVIISTYELLKTPLPSKEAVEKSTTMVEVGSDLTYDDLIEYLLLSNYSRDKYVESQGDFAIRGSIIDVWSFSEKQPSRLEFDGDFLESIRYFDPESQRSSERVESISVASQISAESSDDIYNSSIFDYLNSPLTFATMMNLEKLFNPVPKQERDEAADDLDEELRQEIFEDEKENDKEVTNSDAPLFNSSEDLFKSDTRWIIEQEIIEDPATIELSLHDTPPINANFKFLFNVLKKYAEDDFNIFITTENELQSKRLVDLLSEVNEEFNSLIESSKLKIFVLPIKKGFISPTDKFAVFSDYELFNKPYRTRITSKKRYKKSKARDLASLKRGDYVVHETFGIGRYAGLETIKIGMTDQESIKIQYAEDGVVYVNLNYLSLVKKFSSNENVKPKLTNLGSNEWKSTKKKVKKKIKDAARKLIQLYAERKSARGFAYSADTVWQKELEASFMYEDTPDQTKVTDEVKSDMEADIPMDRLVCGDVGFGKTEVAVRAAFKAVNDGKQAALLVPTTILCEQHYNTFQDRLSQFPVKVAALSRFATKKEQTVIVEELTEGKVDIVIGTHRLLSKDIAFKDLGLLMIDEEHRFGVMAKEKLRSIKANVDTLALTATPIPRTLNLSLLGARDLSIIATPPPNRQPIYTKVDKFEIRRIRKWILNEINRGGQIYFVHDRVQSIEKVAKYLARHIPEIKIAVAHGQLKPSQLEKVIHDFVLKKYDVLVCTKIIESGLDIPSVNTIIVNRADRFGLAELHQLRGRVGRSDKQAYAYLLVPSLKSLAKKAVKRLHAIEEYTDLGEGFNLSMRDLEIRGAGNLLGTEQSGAIDTVGFDMYVKLLDEAVEELKRSEFKDEFKDLPKAEDRSAPTIDTYFEIGIPKNYMPDQADRLSFYTALFSIIKIEETDEIVEEMNDRFGKMPDQVSLLVQAAQLRFYASILLFERIVVTKGKISLILPKGEREEFYTTKFTQLMEYIMNNYGRDIRLVHKNEIMKLDMQNKLDKPEVMLTFITNLCTELINNVIK
jgi:transcription-repair coupling factor (superfamily II helicase)